MCMDVCMYVCMYVFMYAKYVRICMFACVMYIKYIMSLGPVGGLGRGVAGLNTRNKDQILSS